MRATNAPSTAIAGCAAVVRDRDLEGIGVYDQRLYVQQDANYNPASLSDNTGVVVERFLFDPYGVATFLDPDWATDAGGSDYAWTHLHQGGRQDPLTGLVHFRLRDYAAHLGRWTQQDPAGYIDSANRAEYLLSNPAEYVDPQGLWPHIGAHWNPSENTNPEQVKTAIKKQELLNFKPLSGESASATRERADALRRQALAHALAADERRRSNVAEQGRQTAAADDQVSSMASARDATLVSGASLGLGALAQGVLRGRKLVSLSGSVNGLPVSKAASTATTIAIGRRVAHGLEILGVLVATVDAILEALRNGYDTDRT